MGHNFKNAAQRVAGFQNSIDFTLHLLFEFGICAVKQNLFAIVQSMNLFPRDVLREGDSSCSHNMTQNFDAKFSQQQLRKSADGDSCCGLPCRRALKNVTSFRKIVFESSSEIGMARSR